MSRSSDILTVQKNFYANEMVRGVAGANNAHDQRRTQNKFLKKCLEKALFPLGGKLMELVELFTIFSLTEVLRWLGRLNSMKFCNESKYTGPNLKSLASPRIFDCVRYLQLNQLHASPN